MASPAGGGSASGGKTVITLKLMKIDKLHLLQRILKSTLCNLTIHMFY